MSNPPDKSGKSSTDDDFTASMARLAELAAEKIESDEKKREKARGTKDSDFTEFMTAKRKAPEELNLGVKVFGRKFKVRINPYIASGIMIALISVGFICAPKISKYFAEQAEELERKRAAAAQIASQTDASLKSYTVFDAASDVSQNPDGLRTLSIDELAKEVAAANERFGDQTAVSWNFGDFDLAPDGSVNAINDSSYESEGEDEVSVEDSAEAGTEEEYLDLPAPEGWDSIELADQVLPDYAWQAKCTDPWVIFLDGGDESFLQDVLLAIGAVGGTRTWTESCSS